MFPELRTQIALALCTFVWLVRECVIGVGVAGLLCSRGNCPELHGPAGWKLPAIPRNRAASGKAVAKAIRTRVAVSVIRAAILSRRVRSGVNSAVANACCLGMVS